MRHLDYLNEKLLDVASGATRNLAVFAPPRHGKSKLISVYFVAWYLGTYPDRTVIMASHSASLASKFGLQARDVMEEFGAPIFGVKVRPDRRAIDNWATCRADGTPCSGGMLSVGVGGSLIGEGADLMIFDDIIASSEAAMSETIRNNTHDWYESTAETRLNAGGAQVFTMQRWHDDDPAGRIVMANRPAWDVVNLPALAEDDDQLGRTPGQALWPEKYPVAFLESLEARKPFWFAAQYQQRPVPRGGGMFRASWFEDHVVHYRPEADYRVRWWDRAASDGKGDFTVGLLMARKGDLYYVEDVVRGQWATSERDRIIRATCKEDNDRHPFGVTTYSEQEPGSSGKDAAIAFERMLAPYAAHAIPSTGSKVVRADGFAGACGRGDVRMLAADWNDAFVQELSTFPFGKKDDQVDAASSAYSRLALEAGETGAAEAMDESDVEALGLGWGDL